jgi:hypothetical protein
LNERAVTRQKPCEACDGDHFSESYELDSFGFGPVRVVTCPHVPRGQAYLLDKKYVERSPFPLDYWTS